MLPCDVLENVLLDLNIQDYPFTQILYNSLFLCSRFYYIYHVEVFSKFSEVKIYVYLYNIYNIYVHQDPNHSKLNPKKL